MKNRLLRALLIFAVTILLVQCAPDGDDAEGSTETIAVTDVPWQTTVEQTTVEQTTVGTETSAPPTETETEAETADETEDSTPSTRPLDEGKAFLGDLLGFSQEDVTAELTAHEQDDFYLGTIYRPFAWRSPKGDTSYNGEEGMNCGGFVTYVALRAGLDIKTFDEAIRKSPYWFEWATESANGWYLYVRREPVQYYQFESKEELLASGLARKGDLILTWISHSTSLKNDNHIGFFWGETPEEDRMWNSSYKRGENVIGPVEAGGKNSTWYLVPISG